MEREREKRRKCRDRLFHEACSAEVKAANVRASSVQQLVSSTKSVSFGSRTLWQADPYSENRAPGKMTFAKIFFYNDNNLRCGDGAGWGRRERLEFENIFYIYILFSLYIICPQFSGRCVIQIPV